MVRKKSNKIGIGSDEGVHNFKRLVRKALTRKVSSEQRFERSKRISQGDERGWGEEPSRKTEVSLGWKLPNVL